MSITHYGIYISWPPTVDLRHEGLGRYLAAFVKGASAHPEVQFTILCPSWSHQALEELFSSESVPKTSYTLASPKKAPPALRIFKTLQEIQKKRSRTSIKFRIIRFANKKLSRTLESTLQKIVSAESAPKLLLRLTPLIIITLIAIALSPAILIAASASILISKLLKSALIIQRPFKKNIERIKELLINPKEDGLAFRMYREMESAEVNRMLKIANSMRHIKAWYCPTAFWPHFNQIKAPRLVCVPDVVLSDYPVGFSEVGGNRFLQTFEAVESTIYGAENFVTYSQNVKWNTLVSNYQKSASTINVIHHAPNTLNEWITVFGFENPAETTKNYCRSLFSSALLKSKYHSHTDGVSNTSLDYIFYASQLRPNKNVISLLRAYKHLADNGRIKHKLIITGNPEGLPAVNDYITSNNLESEIFCLHGLSTHELAACYKLATLAVNPSLSEGGCPFTFTEALSVDTPVIMARIPVTEEVLTDPQLQEMTFFDPYDWQDLASRIEWALANRDELLAIQRKTYAQLAQRTWADVVDEHLQVLERISEAPQEKTLA